uniref:Uncharacterized protein n=1 Tax=Xiangshan picorna-like virus 6 TaxID=2886222 RepID=A0A8K1YQN9_9VIRU|nr:MAG: hypothetical protein [Xiangshan picorna-like virus 6]
MSQAELNFAPPRVPSVSAVPTPQTCYGALESSGVPFSEIETITDIGPDFGWMSQVNVYQGSFEFKTTDSAIGRTAAVLFDTDVLSYKVNDNNKYLHQFVPSWHLPCFTLGRYWNGSIVYRFLAIKPPRVTGKLVIRYDFTYVHGSSTGGDDVLSKDTSQRGTLKEWDLGQSNTCEFEITAVNPTLARPTWLPVQLNPAKNQKGEPVYYARQHPTRAQSAMGSISVQVAQRLQPGGIFPDQIRILVFRSFKNFSTYIPTDMRGSQAHCFLQLLERGQTRFPPISK